MAAGDLTTKEAVKRDLGLQHAQDDRLLEEWITGVSGWIVNYCNQPILSTAHSDVLDGRGGSVIFLRYSPVTAISLLSVGTTTYTAATPGAEDTGYFYDSRGLVRLRYATFTKGIGNVQVTYTAGYATAPAEMERAALRIVAWRYKEKDRLAHQSKSVGGEVVSYLTAAAAEDVLKILDNFKRVTPA